MNEQKINHAVEILSSLADGNHVVTKNSIRNIIEIVADCFLSDGIYSNESEKDIYEEILKLASRF